MADHPAGFFPIAVLLLAGAGLFSRSIAFSIAMWMGLRLSSYGFDSRATEKGRAWVATLLTAGITAAFGVSDRSPEGDHRIADTGG